MSYTLAQQDCIVPVTATVAVTQGQLVKVAGATLSVCTGTTTRPFGVVLEDAEIGATASIAVPGPIVFLEAHAAIAVGDTLLPAAAGRVVTGTTTLKVMGMALEAAIAQGDLIKCVLYPQLP